MTIDPCVRRMLRDESQIWLGPPDVGQKLAPVTPAGRRP